MRSLVVGLLALSTWSAQAFHPDVTLYGACTKKSFLNGVRFYTQGQTYSGAPYYKGTSTDGTVSYLYWDPDCGGSGDGSARWIIDDSAPSTTATKDLDGDGDCQYHARINSDTSAYPPTNGFWTMRCGATESERSTVVVELIAMTTTVTTSTTTATKTTTTTHTSTTKTETKTVTTTHTVTTTTRTVTVTTTITTTTTNFISLKLSGLCSYKAALNGLTFDQEGFSANGARYFKAVDASYYIYYDEDCNGGSNNGLNRWIIDSSPPNPTLLEDLDEDGNCNYHARLDWDDPGTIPSAESTWKVWCGLGWEEQTVYLDNLGTWEYDDGQAESSILELRGNFDAASCGVRNDMNGIQFEYQGAAATGAPYYKSTSTNHFIYFDPACNGVNESNRWVIDTDEPDLTVRGDLDNDGQCEYLARVKTDVGGTTPKGAMWRVYCEPDWVDIWIALYRVQSTTLSTTAAPTTNSTDSDGDSGHDDDDDDGSQKAISGAGRTSSVALAGLFAAFALFFALFFASP